MSEDLKPTGADEPIRKPIVIPVNTETEDGTRSVSKDRLPGAIVADAENDHPPVVRKPVVIPVDTETDDGNRSVTKDRLPGDIVTDAADEQPPVVRKPIVIELQTEA